MSSPIAPRNAMDWTGIGWRQPHHAEVLQRLPALGFLEVHSENFCMPGGAARALLRAAREHYPISLHGVGLSLGSASGLDLTHLHQLAALVREVQPVRVSEHAAFARGVLGAPHSLAGHTVHAGDLLPLAYTQASLVRLVSQVQQAQEVLGRPLGIENVSAYLRAPSADWGEAEFLAELARRSGCHLLLDLNNLIVNALNAGASDPLAHACHWMDALPRDAVNQYHLAGHSAPVAGALVIDDHGAPVAELTWQAYAHALHRFGPQLTLIEWDTDVPALDVLVAEAGRAAATLEAACAAPCGHD